MGYATIVVQADADDDGRDRIGLAAALAQQFDATLVGVAARDLVPMLTMPGSKAGIGVLFLAAEQEVHASLAAAKRQFHDVTDHRQQRVVWRSTVADPTSTLTAEARTADLIVVGRRLEHADTRRSRHPDPGNVLMRAGRPVLVVPPGSSHLDLHQRVVVAWKDSLEARRAVVDALPFLTRASSVLVVQVCRTDTERQLAEAAVQEIVVYLSEHGVRAIGNAKLLREASVSAELLVAAEQHHAELIVAGGYAHSRLQEWVFGGVTNTLLGHSTKCCLLSH